MIILKEDRSNKYNPTHKKMHELWRSMMGRCYSCQSSSYKNYGMLGVTVCEKWKEYDGFLDEVDKIDGFDLDMLIAGDLQLDKDIKQIDIPSERKVYSLNTCMFVSRSLNSANRYNNKKFIAINILDDKIEITNNREEFCRNHGLDSSTVFRILKRTSGESQNYSSKGSNFSKGWTFIYFDNPDLSKIPTVRTYEIYNKQEDKTYIALSLRDFCIKNNLSYGGAQSVLKGRQNVFSNHWYIKEKILDYKSATTIERTFKELSLAS